MSFLVANLPPLECWVLPEYLNNHEPTDREPEPCIWISTKSLKGRAWYFEVLLTNYGALYDKLPISSLIWKPNVKRSELLPVHILELWDCFSYEFTVLEKTTLRNLRCKVKLSDNKLYLGNYVLTLDNVVSDSNVLDTSFGQVPSEHKSFNLIKLDQGQFALVPNNRCIFIEPSHTPTEIKRPWFKANGNVYNVEGHPERMDTFGNTDDWLY